MSGPPKRPIPSAQKTGIAEKRVLPFRLNALLTTEGTEVHGERIEASGIGFLFVLRVFRGDSCVPSGLVRVVGAFPGALPRAISFHPVGVLQV